MTAAFIGPSRRDDPEKILVAVGFMQHVFQVTGQPQAFFTQVIYARCIKDVEACFVGGEGKNLGDRDDLGSS